MTSAEPDALAGIRSGSLSDTVRRMERETGEPAQLIVSRGRELMILGNVWDRQGKYRVEFDQTGMSDYLRVLADDVRGEYDSLSDIQRVFNIPPRRGEHILKLDHDPVRARAYIQLHRIVGHIIGQPQLIHPSLGVVTPPLLQDDERLHVYNL